MCCLCAPTVPASSLKIRSGSLREVDLPPPNKRLKLTGARVGRIAFPRLRARTAETRSHVLVVSPALNSPLRHWVSDSDEARAAAYRRLDDSLGALREAGIEAAGEVGDSDPLQAIEDAMRTFGPDEIVISTHPEGRSNWLERGVVTGARERFTVPITHVVVDLEAEREEVR